MFSTDKLTRTILIRIPSIRYMNLDSMRLCVVRKINIELDGDYLEGLSHLTFKEPKGEWNIKYGHVTTGL